MAGGYTHITVAQLGIEEAIYRRPGLLSDDVRLGLAFFKKYCIVGAISPDYPYMQLGHDDSAAWADAIHKGHAVDLLRAGAKAVAAIADENIRHKCLAWLFGFASHLVTDGVIHPVVNLKVGVYEQHKTEHRVCEMNQDVYIDRRLGLGALDSNHQITLSVKSVSDPANADKLDPDIETLWRGMLKQTYHGHPEPDIDGWHRGMRRVMEVWEHGNYLFFARDKAARDGLVYPADADPQFIKGLAIPGNTTQDFDPIVDKTIGHILDMWGWLSLMLQGKASPLDTLPNWSLDTGIDDTGKMIYWG